jgi:hypothetical protein
MPPERPPAPDARISADTVIVPDVVESGKLEDTAAQILGGVLFTAKTRRAQR